VNLRVTPNSLSWIDGELDLTNRISEPFKKNGLKCCIFFNIRLVVQGLFTGEVTEGARIGEMGALIVIPCVTTFTSFH
jgi:hypothetical protein